MARYNPCRYVLLRYLPASIQMGVQTKEKSLSGWEVDFVEIREIDRERDD